MNEDLKKLTALALSNLDNKVTMAKTVVHLMETVEKNNNLKGPEKKKLLINVFNAINKSTDNNHNIDIGLLSDVIDVIIDASRGKFNLNKVLSVSERLYVYISKLKCCLRTQ